MYRAGPVARTGPAVARERPRTDPDFGGSNRREETATDFLKWDTAQPGAKLAAMSNKSKSQPQQQQQQQPQHQQQQQQHHHPTHVIKPVDQLPPRYQPPPQPTSGILKNHLHFANGVTSAPNSAQAGNSQGPGAALNHHQSTQPRTLPPPPSTLQHHPQQQHQPQQLTQSQQQAQQQAPKDAQSKYSPRIEHHHHHPQQGNALIAAASVTTSKSQQQQQPPTYFQQAKLGQGSYLPPSSQYPTVNSGQSAPIRQRISDDEFLRLGPVEMLKFVRKTESDIARLAAEQNRQIQSLVSSSSKFSGSVND